MVKGLGKGINALFGDIEVGNEETIQEVDVTELRPNPYQPRKFFDEEGMEELTKSIMQHGILQPIIVRRSIKGYEIVVGERRYRAAKAANLKKVPVVVRDMDEQEMMELAVLENLQREDLTPIEEAEAYQTLIERLDLTQEQLAKRLGKSRPHIANHLRLLSLPTKILNYISDGKLSMGHGRTLLGLKQKEKIEPLAQKVVKENLNVRQLEKMVNELNKNVSRETKRRKKEKKDIYIREYEDHLRDKFGTTVKIKQLSNKGKIEIEFLTKDDLERILEIMNHNN